MSYCDARRRLAKLEALEAAQALAQDGYAPEAWSRLAPWALAVCNAGGWEAALALVQRAERLPAPDPYAGVSGGPLWDIVIWWQRGNTARLPSRAQEQQALRLIVGCAEQLHADGMTPAEWSRWETTGRAVWQAVMHVLKAEETDAVPSPVLNAGPEL